MICVPCGFDKVAQEIKPDRRGTKTDLNWFGLVLV